MEATMHLTDLLTADYENVLHKLDDMERVIEALAEPKTALPDLETLGNFFRRDIWALVWKEENALFPELVRSASWESGPIGRMFVGHKNLRGLNERFQSGVDGYLKEPGNKSAMTLLVESGQQIVALLQNHIKEESGMLQRVAVRLDEAQNRQILETFETVDADLAWCFEQLEGFYP